jgi:phage/plasmid-like protein (TIGR03299 family)
MSRETLAHLNTQTLIGYTSKRGQAWHYRADAQGGEPNHYEHAIPVADIRRRLFHWSPVEADLQAVAITDDGVSSFTDPTAIVRPDTGAILGVFRSGYKVHDYDRWLIENVETILDADLQVGSAGLLRGGAVAWVQVEMADTLTVAGVEFRPFLTATTSMDGSIATTYQTGAQVVVCDNTLSAALHSGDAARIKIRHSRHSLNRLQTVRDALGIVHRVADDFAAQVEALTDQAVTEAQWDRFVAAYTGTDDNTQASRRALTSRREQATTLNRLWTVDERVRPWRGTAYGVLAAANTYAHHLGPVRGATRIERNAERLITGKIHQLDAHTLQVLAQVS